MSSSFKTTHPDHVEIINRTRKQRKSKSIGGVVLYYNPLAVQAVLEGYYDYITWMFTWCDSPPSIKSEWSKYQNNHNAVLPEECISFLKCLVRDDIPEDMNKENDY